MADGIPFVFPVDLTRKWRALAERRKAHLVDLYDSGRWRLYYSEREFVLRLREAIRIVEQWSATEQSAVHEAAMVSMAPAGVDGDACRGDAGEGMLFGVEAEDSPGLDGFAAEVPSGAEPENDLHGDPDREMFSAEEAAREREPA